MNTNNKKPLTIDEVMRIQKNLDVYVQKRTKHGPEFTEQECERLLELRQMLGLRKPVRRTSLVPLNVSVQQLRQLIGKHSLNDSTEI